MTVPVFEDSRTEYDPLGMAEAIEPLTPSTVVPIISGGLDSVTMLYYLEDHGFDIVRVVSFNYGQRHARELEYAKLNADRFDLPHTVIDLSKSGLVEVLSKSSSVLVNMDTEVPEGHYAEQNMKATVVPNRNMMMLSIAGSIAVAEGAAQVAAAMHSGDHFIYPDCRPAFIDLLSEAMFVGNIGFGHKDGLGLLTPFINISKTDIAVEGVSLKVPFEDTWSCYKGGEIHCGKCGTCCERLEAISGAEAFLGAEDYDQTVYEDKTYWRGVIARGPEA